eukprot:6745017-Prymnesium_polylepis.1
MSPIYFSMWVRGRDRDSERASSTPRAALGHARARSDARNTLAAPAAPPPAHAPAWRTVPKATRG